jgi:hypothetical protein
MADRTLKETAAATPPVQAGEQPPGAVETAIAAAAATLLPPPRDEDAVRRLAYAYYEERGRVDGHHLDDWLRAEEELSAPDARP